MYRAYHFKSRRTKTEATLVFLQELGVALQEECQQIPRAAVRCIISSMSDRCRACVAAGGGNIRHIHIDLVCG